MSATYFKPYSPTTPTGSPAPVDDPVDPVDPVDHVVQPAPSSSPMDLDFERIDAYIKARAKHQTLATTTLRRLVGHSPRIRQRNQKHQHRHYWQNVYGALCNNNLIIKKQRVALTFREAGAVVATILGKGTYLDWYCSGGRYPTAQRLQAIVKGRRRGPVPEGAVTDEISRDLQRVGCRVVSLN